MRDRWKLACAVPVEFAMVLAMSEPSYLSATRVAYDIVAIDYAATLHDQLAGNPFDRAMLGIFAEVVTDVRRGPVADIGCGPGRVTDHLHSLGLEAFGVDLSPEMVAVSRRTYPELRFDVGSMTDLDLPDGSLGGVVAWYSIIHIPPELLPVVFAQFHRVLVPGGALLLAFQAGDEPRHLDHAYGHDVSVDAYRLPPVGIVALLKAAGFTCDAQLIRQPGRQEKSPHAYILAHHSVIEEADPS
jgi:SAM-dependent methyltransferase